VDFFGTGMLQLELVKGPRLVLVFVRLLLEHGIDLAEVRHSVHGFQAVDLVQRGEPSVGAEHRFEVLRGRLGQDRRQRERDLDELVGMAILQIGRFHPRHQAGIDLLDLGDCHDLAVANQGETPIQEEPVDQVADLRHGVAPLRAQVEGIAR